MSKVSIVPCPFSRTQHAPTLICDPMLCQTNVKKPSKNADFDELILSKFQLRPTFCQRFFGGTAIDNKQAK